MKRFSTGLILFILLFCLFVPSPTFAATPPSTVPASIMQRFRVLSAQYPMIGAAFRDIRVVQGAKYAALVNPPIAYINMSIVRCSYVYCPGGRLNPEIALTYQWAKRLRDWLKAVYPGRLQLYEKAFPGRFAEAFLNLYYLDGKPPSEAARALDRMLRAIR